jgi:hypothetical protein
LLEVKDCGVVAEVQEWLVLNSYTAASRRAFHVSSLFLASSPPVIDISQNSEPLNPRSANVRDIKANTRKLLSAQSIRLLHLYNHSFTAVCLGREEVIHNDH